MTEKAGKELLLYPSLFNYHILSPILNEGNLYNRPGGYKRNYLRKTEVGLCEIYCRFEKITLFSCDREVERKEAHIYRLNTATQCLEKMTLQLYYLKNNNQCCKTIQIFFCKFFPYFHRIKNKIHRSIKRNGYTSPTVPAAVQWL